MPRPRDLSLYLKFEPLATCCVTAKIDGNCPMPSASSFVIAGIGGAPDRTRLLDGEVERAHGAPVDEERRRSGGGDVARERFVHAADDRRQRDDDEHADRHAQDGQRRATLVGADRFERDAWPSSARVIPARSIRSPVAELRWDRAGKRAALDTRPTRCRRRCRAASRRRATTAQWPREAGSSPR